MSARTRPPSITSTRPVRESASTGSSGSTAAALARSSPSRAGGLVGSAEKAGAGRSPRTASTRRRASNGFSNHPAAPCCTRASEAVRLPLKMPVTKTKGTPRVRRRAPTS